VYQKVFSDDLGASETFCTNNNLISKYNQHTVYNYMATTGARKEKLHTSV
jgi:hypothetical protein